MAIHYFFVAFSMPLSSIDIPAEGLKKGIVKFDTEPGLVVLVRFIESAVADEPFNKLKN